MGCVVCGKMSLIGSCGVVHAGFITAFPQSMSLQLCCRLSGIVLMLGLRLEVTAPSNGPGEGKGPGYPSKNYDGPSMSTSMYHVIVCMRCVHGYWFRECMNTTLLHLLILSLLPIIIIHTAK